MAEERGAVCREESPGGVRYWRNWILEVRDEEEDGMAWKPESEEQRKVRERNLADEELSRDLERHFGI
jgi:hypothetical protein